MRKIIALGLVIAYMTLILAGCSKNQKTSEQNTEDNISTIISSLEDHGYTVEKESAEKQLLTGERYRLVLNNSLDSQVVIYEYENREKAKADADCIDKSGTKILFANGEEGTGVNVDWISIPHYYLYGNLIVEYVGTEESILSSLRNVCGPYFAGGADYY